MDYISKPTLNDIARLEYGHRLDRRQFLELVGEIGLAGAVAACGGTPASPFTSTTTKPTAQSRTKLNSESIARASSRPNGS